MNYSLATNECVHRQEEQLKPKQKVKRKIISKHKKPINYLKLNSIATSLFTKFPNDSPSIY